MLNASAVLGMSKVPAVSANRCKMVRRGMGVETRIKGRDEVKLVLGGRVGSLGLNETKAIVDM